MSDTGGGHRSAGQAIADAVARDFPGKYQVTLVDVIARTAIFPFNHVAEWYLPFTTYAEFLWRTLFHLTNNRWLTRLSLGIIRLLIGRSVRRLLREQSPDLVVTVHPVLNEIPQRALRAVGSRAPFVVVVTDLFSAHGLWFNPAADLTLVPTDGARKVGEKWGMSPEKLCIVGLPVSLKFLGDGKSKTEHRAMLGLEPERTTALLVGGGEGMGRLYEIARAIDRARLPLQLVVIAGRNQKLRQKLEASPWHIPVRAQGFVANMPDWMRASDVLITKAGPGTISEALACGLPMVLSGFLPGQEEGNVTFVEESGVGVLCA
ncbi:MAG: glycosyltransferase, partial [Chloroflexota bacterium]|nr:glycosyltransferase [Chloroflexota bacterium]